MIQSSQTYEENLTVIVNTRLIYNTMNEFEQVLDNNSIHNNGIKRSFVGLQKLRSAYRDLKGEVEAMTNGMIDLTVLLQRYREAWRFYDSHFRRTTKPEKLVSELLAYCYPPYSSERLLPRKAQLFEKVVEEQVSVPFLILMLLKVIPGYDSRMGDVKNMPEQFERVIDLLENFVENDSGFSVSPAIKLAREEKHKSRILLFYHVYNILDTYESFADSFNRYDMACYVKSNTVSLDLAGYWNECEGKLTYTEFWQIEEAIDKGSYFMTHWAKDAENRLKGIRYTLFVASDANGELIFYLLHPEYILRRMNAQDYTDSDQAWYTAGQLCEHPQVISLHCKIPSHVWKQRIELTRCTDPGVVSQYDYWIHQGCTIVKPYGHLEYSFHPSLYAITPMHLYVCTETEGEYFQIPKEAYDGFERITLEDNVGTMTIEGTTYLVFDEFLLFIKTDSETLQKYGICRVREIV